MTPPTITNGNAMSPRIPGRLNDRRTPLGELNWIFTAITDTIAWNVLPRGEAALGSVGGRAAGGQGPLPSDTREVRWRKWVLTARRAGGVTVGGRDLGGLWGVSRSGLRAWRVVSSP